MRHAIALMGALTVALSIGCTPDAQVAGALVEKSPQVEAGRDYDPLIEGAERVYQSTDSEVTTRTTNVQRAGDVTTASGTGGTVALELTSFKRP